MSFLTEWRFWSVVMTLALTYGVANGIGTAIYEFGSVWYRHWIDPALAPVGLALGLCAWFRLDRRWFFLAGFGIPTAGASVIYAIGTPLEDSMPGITFSWTKEYLIVGLASGFVASLGGLWERHRLEASAS